ncbi:MAG: ABC transporter ATP-binding protein [Fibrobacter sp.]|nr:ABC transporter ATP-binding protein [Fibrobacter sp.]
MSRMPCIYDMNVAPVLSVRNLSVAFGFAKGRKGALVPRDGVPPLQVTDKVSFEIHSGEFFALVGESGCGKSVTAMSILRLLPQPSAQIVNGEVLFYEAQEHSASKEIDLSRLPLPELQKYRGSRIACIFQEPMQALNPVISIRKQLLEVFRYCAPGGKNFAPAEALGLIEEQLKDAGFTDTARVLDSYPHELSGGMLQRVCIVMSLLSRPRLIIADEPTTALDVTVQAQVLAVLKEMARKSGTAVLLITHNMGIVSQYADRVAVMYAGRIIETGPVREVINGPLHPYTQGLLAAIPESHSQMKNLKSIPGSVPHPRDFVSGCRFADRCEKCMNGSRELQAKCRGEVPPASKTKETGHEACCFDL